MVSIIAPKHLREMANSRFLERQTKKIVKWTDDEWQDLARRVLKKRAREPQMSVVQLANACQKQDDWPKDRVRKLDAAQIKPLLSILTELDLGLHERVRQLEHEVVSLNQNLEQVKRDRPDKDTLLSQMGQEEIERRFAPAVFSNLSPSDIVSLVPADQLLRCLPLKDVFAFACGSLVTGMANLQEQVTEHLNSHHVEEKQSEKKTPSVKATTQSIPKVAVVGFQQHDLPTLKRQIGDNVEIVYVAKTGDQCPQDAAYVIVHDDFTPGPTKQHLKKRHNGHTVFYSGPTERLFAKLSDIPFFKERRKPR